MAKGSLPVVVGVGQSLSQWNGTSGPDGAPSPLSLSVEAARKALGDAGLAADAIDTIAVVKTNEDSVPWPAPNGQNRNLPGTIARDLGTRPARAIYSGVGGQSPQQLVNEMSARIHDGELDCVLIVGAEANRASKGARRNGIALDWADDDDLPFEDRVDEERMLTRPEIKHGLVSPPYFYGLFENAIAAREGRTRSQHRLAMSKLWETFAAVAAGNPNAQFQVERSATFLATPSKENFEIADPFLKWHVAQDAVNVGAAVILMSEDKAKAFGVAADKQVFVHGGGEAKDPMISLRVQMDGSWAMKTALGRALDQAGKSAADMAMFDLYSCFPCAVFSSTAALGIDPLTETRPLTVTGGLPFFGGPGNNYSLHGLASLAERLREQPGAFGLVLANGGWMTKEAAGVYSTARPAGFAPTEPMAKNPDEADLVDAAPAGTLETFTVVHGKSGPETGIAFIRTPQGQRILANAGAGALDVLREEKSPIGAPVTATHADEVNTFSFS